MNGNTNFTTNPENYTIMRKQDVQKTWKFKDSVKEQGNEETEFLVGDCITGFRFYMISSMVDLTPLEGMLCRSQRVVGKMHLS